MQTPFFILGPCSLENEAFAYDMARQLKQIAEQVDLTFYFKASYDKANRTAFDSFRGLGVKDGCKILGEISKELDIPVTTDVHSCKDIEIAAQQITLLQIPAFLCRQTDLIKVAAETGRAINVKKGQFLAPWDAVNIAEKLEHFGCKEFYITERGSSFGYNNLVADMRSLYWMREKGLKVVFDATHSVQRPGGMGNTTGGDGELAPVLAKAAIAVGVDGLFMETHSNPSQALSDGPNQIPLSEMPSLLKRLKTIHHASHSDF